MMRLEIKLIMKARKKFPQRNKERKLHRKKKLKEISKEQKEMLM